MKFFFLCPKCGKLYETFYEKTNKIVDKTITIQGDGSVDTADEDVVEECLVNTFCPKCGLISKTWLAEEFLIKRVSDSEIEPFGDYWLDNIDELEKIAKKLGFKKVRDVRVQEVEKGR